MIDTLKRIVILSSGLKVSKGTFPNFQRKKGTTLDMVGFQFDKWGDRFVVEIGTSEMDHLIEHPKELNSEDQMTVWHLHPNRGRRLGSSDCANHWLRYDKFRWLPFFNAHECGSQDRP